MNEETSEALDILYGAFFDLNATLDRFHIAARRDFWYYIDTT